MNPLKTPYSGDLIEEIAWRATLSKKFLFIEEKKEIKEPKENLLQDLGFWGGRVWHPCRVQLCGGEKTQGGAGSNLGYGILRLKRKCLIIKKLFSFFDEIDYELRIMNYFVGVRRIVRERSA